MKKYITALASTFIICAAHAQTPITKNTTPEAPSAASMAKADAKRDMRNEQHINDLHAKLKITAEQEKLWDSVVKTMRDNAKEIDKVIDKREATIATATAIDDLKAYAEIAQVHADSIKKLSDAFAPLYKAMPDTQKKLADEVFMQRIQEGKFKNAVKKS
jgi:hypothetical protein